MELVTGRSGSNPEHFDYDI